MWFPTFGRGLFVSRASRVRPRSFRPRLEVLEDRTVPTLLTVVNSSDSGMGSLRYVIEHANAADKINFDLSPGHVTSPITLSSGVLDITKNLTIEGPGARTLTISGGGSSVASPTATLSATNVNVADYGLTAYSFSVTYASDTAILAARLSGAVVQVVPPSGVGSPITATVVSTVANGPTDPEGDAPSFTVTYQITPPGGQWTAADNGIYTVNLGGSPVTDIDGTAIPTGSVGTFDVETGKIAINKYGLIHNPKTGLWSETVNLTNTDSSAPQRADLRSIQPAGWCYS